MKKCKRCDNTKELDCFYTHPKAKDGYMSICKECAKKAAIKNRKEKIEYYLEYDRKRINNIDRAKQRKEYYLRNKDNKKYKEMHLKASYKYISNNRDKSNARSKVAYYLAKGMLKKEDCSICGDKNTHAHHPDYNYPLNIVWLCSSCHKKEHRRINRENA